MCKELPYFLITFPKNTTGGKGQKKEIMPRDVFRMQASKAISVHKIIE